MAQVSNEFLSFIPEGYKYINASGPGMENESGDILVELTDLEFGEEVKLIILNKTIGKLSVLAENSELLMGKELLGTSGANYPQLIDRTLYVNYSLGSGSAFSNISMVFEKNNDGHYYFVEYTYSTTNNGKENLSQGKKITAAQTGRISFSEAREEMILNKKRK